MALRFIRRVLSEDVPGRKDTRISHYEIRDAFLRFYFQFVYRHPELIEQDRVARLSAIVRDNFDAYVGCSGYEELARALIIRLGDSGELPFLPDYIGRAWNRSTEIDVIAINWKDRSVLLGECKWQSKKLPLQALADLRARGERLTRLKEFKKHYALFAKAGFTRALLQQARDESSGAVFLFQGAELTRV